MLNSDLVFNSSDIITVSKEVGNVFSEMRREEFAMELLGTTEDISQIRRTTSIL